MADQELGIQITGEISDIIGKLDELVEMLGGLTDQTMDVTINTDTTPLSEIAAAAMDASNSMENVAGSAGDASAGLAGISPETLIEAASAATSLGDNLSEVSRSATEAATSIGNVGNETDKAVGAAASAAGAAAITEGIKGMANAAGGFIDEWRRIGAVMGEGLDISSVQAKWQPVITEMTNATGRGAGAARNFLIQMGLAGVESADVITSSFEAVGGMAFMTGTDIDTVTQAFRRVVSTGMLGNRQLMSLGLTTEDVMSATGMSVEEVSKKLQGMTTEQRAAFLASIMNAKGAKEANEAYKVSWEHATDAVSRAGTAIMIVAGKLILPILVPALELVTGLLQTVAGVIDKIPGPIQAVLGAVILLAGGYAGLALVLSSAVSFLELISASLTVNAIRQNAATLATYARAAAEGVYAGFIWAANAAMTVYNALTAEGALAKAASTLATWAATAATTAWTAATWLASAAMAVLDALMDANPIMLVVLAIAALVAGLVWLYNNFEPFKNLVDGAWAALVGLGNYMAAGFPGAIDAIKNAVLWLLNLPGMLQQMATDAIIGFARGILNSIPNVSAAMAQFFKPLTDGINWLLNLPSSMFNAAVTIITNFGQGFITAVKNLPGQAYEWGKSIVIAFLKGMAEASPAGLAEKITKYIVERFKSDSPPKKGPLRDIDKWGSNIGQTWLNGLFMGMEAGSGDLDAVMAKLGTILSNVNVKTDDKGVKGQEKAATTVEKVNKDILNSVKLFISGMTRYVPKVHKLMYDFSNEIVFYINWLIGYVPLRAEFIGESITGGFSSGFDRNLPQVKEKIKAMEDEINGLWGVLVGLRDNAKQLGTDMMVQLIAGLNSKVELIRKGMYYNGLQVIYSFRQGMIDGATVAQSALRQAIERGSKELASSSPPKVGPLKDIDKWGLSIGRTWGDMIGVGISDSLGNLNKPLTDLTGRLIPGSFDVPHPARAGLRGGGDGGGNIIINVNLSGANISSNVDAAQAGQIAGDEAGKAAAARLERQGVRRGYSTINNMRG